MKTWINLLNLFTICIIAILPHMGWLPNFLYAPVILVWVYAVLRLQGQGFKDIGFAWRHFRLKFLPIGFISAAVILAFMQLVFFPILESFYAFPEVELKLYDILRENWIQLTVMIIMGWLVGGFYEELVFHGFIYTRMEKWLPGDTGRILNFLITALIFGLYHLQMGTLGWVNAFFVGMVYLGLYVYFKKNLWYSILAHGFYNTLVMILIFLGYL